MMTEQEYSPLAEAFAELLFRRSGSEDMRDWGARIIEALEEGNSYLETTDQERAGLNRFPELVSHSSDENWQKALLVLDGIRLYIVRQLFYEIFCAEKIAARLRRPLHPLPEELRHGMSNPEQDQALLHAAERDFAVITGGPGTGKTYVTAALIRAELARDPGLKITPAAPTGKAAQCLSAELKGSGIEAQTLQRLFGQLYSGVFRVNEEYPLDSDLLIVDESSMISLEQFARMLNGLKPETRLILIGDRQQLPAIESGAVLREFCSEENGLPENTVSELTINFRSKEAPSVVELAALLRTGELSNELLTEKIIHADKPDLVFRENSPEALSKAAARGASLWSELPALGYDGSPEAREKAFRLLEEFRILTALRHGPEGCEFWNKMIMKKLGFRTNSDFGMAVLVTGNSPGNQLFNGDIGIVFRTGKGPKVFFPNREEPVAAGELPGFEPAFVMTVHKAQGSGFNRVLFLLPQKPNPVLSRELFYTALTRARKGIEIIGKPEIIRSALDISCRRTSALAERIRALLDK